MPSANGVRGTVLCCSSPVGPVGIWIGTVERNRDVVDPRLAGRQSRLVSGISGYDRRFVGFAVAFHQLPVAGI